MRREEFVREDVESFKSQLCNLQKAYMVRTPHTQSHPTTCGRIFQRSLILPVFLEFLKLNVIACGIEMGMEIELCSSWYCTYNMHVCPCFLHAGNG